MSTLSNQRQVKSQALPFLFEQPKRVAVFCRNGCHFSMVASEHDYHSCPACNSQMTATAEDAYMESLENAGNVQ